VPMQFLILLIGALLFTFYQFKSGPIFYNSAVSEKVYATPYGDSLKLVEKKFEDISAKQSTLANAYITALKQNDHNVALLKDSMRTTSLTLEGLRSSYKNLLKKADGSIDTNDTNYIFLRFVVDNLPAGLVGLLIAIIFLAAWGSIAAALNSLASCTMIDFYCRFKEHNPHADSAHIHERHHYRLSKWFTFAWGIFCIVMAEFSNRMGSLIEAVNVLGSLFYGVILGIFLVAFYMKRVGANTVFWSAVIGELIVIALFILDKSGIIGFGFLWLNVAGALAVVLLSWLLHLLTAAKVNTVTAEQ